MEKQTYKTQRNLEKKEGKIEVLGRRVIKTGQAKGHSTFQLTLYYAE